MRIRLVSIIILVMFLSYIAINAYPFGFTKEGRETVNIQTILVSDFGDEYDQTHNIKWEAEFGPFAVRISDPATGLQVIDTNYCNYKYLPGKPLGLPAGIEEKQQTIFGVKASFWRKGFNWIIVKPQQPIKLTGIVKSFDFWVWGGNYEWDIYLYLKDYKGYVYYLKVGDLKFTGWRNFRTKIPEWMPQYEPYVPYVRPLDFVKFKLISAPQERADRFFIYFDYMQLQTDIYMERFNGDDLAKISTTITDW